MKRIIVLCLVLFVPVLFSREQRVRINFTNDIHGHLSPTEASFINPEHPPPLGNAASLAAFTQESRQTCRENGYGYLLLDIGDIFSGGLEGTLSGGKAVVSFMNNMKYAATVPGNHDFDQGWENLTELTRISEFPWLACNVTDVNGNIPSFLKEFEILEISGIKFGITGICLTATTKMSFPENISAIRFVDEVTALQQTVNKMLPQTDFIIVLSHFGIPYNLEADYSAAVEKAKTGWQQGKAYNSLELSMQVPGIDLMLNGHIHKGWEEPIICPFNHTIHLQTHGNGNGIGELDLVFDSESKKLIRYETTSDRGVLHTMFAEDWQGTPQMKNEIDEERKKWLGNLERVIAVAESDWNSGGRGESLLGNLITDAMRSATSADIAFTNTGGIRQNIRQGEVTMADIFEVLPFGNSLVVAELTGQQLWDLISRKFSSGRIGLVYSGMSVRFSEAEKKVTAILINNQKIDFSKNYRCVTTDYLAAGNSGMGMLSALPSEKINYTGLLDREVLSSFLQNNKGIQPALEGRFTTE